MFTLCHFSLAGDAKPLFGTQLNHGRVANGAVDIDEPSLLKAGQSAPLCAPVNSKSGQEAAR
jgi:hypothetical protein